MDTRKKIKPKERLVLFSLFNFICNICEYKFNVPFGYDGTNTLMENGIWLEIDHIIPISKCGLDIFNNKQPLCNKCNSKKYNNG